MNKIALISLLILMMNQFISAQECPDSVIISGIYQVPYTGSHDWIQSSGATQIPVGANVVLDANPGNNGFIRLNEGFRALPGSIFQAVVNTPCALSGTNQQGLTEHLQVFPNPNNGNFTVELPNAAEQGLRLKIVDFAGRHLLEQATETGNNVQTIEAQQLPKGLYFLQMISEGRIVAIEKFVVQ
jgi:Secretion system C-terminal sorting domain